MPYNLTWNLEYCGEYVSNVSDILLYSHVPSAIVTILLAAFVIYYNRAHVLTWSLAILSLLFTAWVGLNLTIWFSYDNAPALMFSWSQIESISVLLFCYLTFFTYEYLFQQRLLFRYKCLALLPVLPVIFFASSSFVTLYDAQECIAVETSWYATYVLYIKILFSIVTLALLIYTLYKKTRKRTEILILSFGVLSFMYSFLFAGFIAEKTSNFTYELYGLFPMIIFVGSLVYLIVKYTAFNIRLLGANAIIFTLVALVGSQIFSFTTYTDLVIDIVTTLFVIIFSFFLIHAIRTEIKQKEEIEKLAVRLEKANKRLRVLDQMKSEFVSIASHQLRSPLTSIRGYASMLREGSFGKLPEKAKDAVTRIDESSRLMAMSVEDYLNVSRIEAGRMKYEYSDFNLKDLAERVVDDLRQRAIKKGLLLTFKARALKSRGMTHADFGKAHQIIHNLVDNALKYTEKGRIEVVLSDNKKAKTISVSISDTGVGMNKEAVEEVFEKFVRARNANQVNVTGTGLGLYVAKKMAEGMGGDITLSSPGEGLGSTFTFTLPLSGKGK